jgi:hypothetical protein
VKISSPIQAQTETDSRGRFKFKLENLQSDTFLLIIQNKKTYAVAKQNEYVNASSGRTDIVVVFGSDTRDNKIFSSFDDTSTNHQSKRPPKLKQLVRKGLGLFR